MNFSIKINKKPVGNFRPLVEIAIDIKSADYPHRPFLNGLAIAARYPEEMYLPRTIRPDRWMYLDQGARNGHDPFIWLGDLPAEEEICLYREQKKGNNAILGYGEQLDGTQVSYNRLLGSEYLESDISIVKMFYLPYRSGRRPDYSDFAARLAMVPIFIEEELQNGFGSGESREILITPETITKWLDRENPEADDELPSRKLRLM